MNIKELAEKKADILGARLTGDELMSLKEGMTLFGGVVAAGNRPMDEREVLTSGFRFVANIDRANACVDFLGLTRGGYAAIFTYDKTSLSTTGFLFFTKGLNDTARMSDDSPRKQEGASK